MAEINACESPAGIQISVSAAIGAELHKNPAKTIIVSTGGGAILFCCARLLLVFDFIRSSLVENLNNSPGLKLNET